MRQTTRLEVVADGEKWSVKEHGIGRLSTHATKAEASSAARSIAAIHTPCLLIIRNENGTIESENSYDKPGK